VTSVGFNASTDLGPLEYNGGDTKTHALLNTGNKPDFQQGKPAYAGTLDQRGETRLTPPCIGAYDGKAVVSVNIKVFLQGPLQANGKMTNYIQVPNNVFSVFSAPRLPVENPYEVKDLSGAAVSCSGINNVGEVGEVVDWIKVEVRLASDPTAVLESRALLLRPDGTVVGTNGEPPVFDMQSPPVYLLVSHRNHLSVMSTEINLTGGVVTYDFSTGLSQAFKYRSTDPAPMVQANGRWCLWAGDLNGDDIIDYNDISLMQTGSALMPSDKYVATDLNMDGIVNYRDNLLFMTNILLNLYSAIFNY